jgi:two-component system, NarL family, invasion response regulator UvrY
MRRKILIVDDHAIVRLGIKEILLSDPSVEMIQEAATAGEAWELIQTQAFHVILLDLGLPDQSGFELLLKMKMEQLPGAVIFLTNYPPEQFKERALKAGAIGFLPKSLAPTTLIKAIHSAYQNKPFQNSEFQDLSYSKNEYRNQQKLLHNKLSNREFQVLLYFSKGLTVTQIAKQLGLSSKTISTYRARLLDKMEMNTNAELIHYAFKNNLTETESNCC